MTSVGINAASLGAQTSSFVSVSMSQVTVTKGQDFSKMLSGKLTAQASQGNTRTYTDLKLTRIETGKEATPVSAKGTDAVQTRTAIEKNGQSQEVKADAPDETKAQVEETGNGKDLQNTQQSQQTQQVQNEGGLNADAKELDDCVKALEILNTMMIGIAQILETTTENLMGSYEQLGIEPSEMFTVTSIQLTVVTFEGLNDTSDLLVNSDAYDLFNRINEFVQSVLDEAGIDLQQFEDIMQSDMFAEFIGPVGTGSVEEILSEFVFDENGKLVVQDKPEEAGPVVRAQNDEPFTVEVNVDRSVVEAGNKAETSDTQTGTGTGSESTAEGSRTQSAAKTEQRDARTPLTPAQSFIQGLENAIQVTDIDMPVAEGVTVRDIVYQVVDAIRVNISAESTSLEMNLNPENLGHVSLNIQSRDGVMTAQITAENDTARAAIESQLQILKDNIEAQGVRVEAIEVTVSSFSFSDSRNAESEAREHPEANGRVGRTGRSQAAGAEESVAETLEREKLEQEVMEQNGSTVSYTA
ncbi:MAG: flagellar hook-length control protein FliK [Lachnospiraceae bacterium]|nr:flagellar hook-length control protein FliK [Lachnospiraceae bacterium]